MEKKPHVAIIIPAYDEVDNLEIILPHIRAVLQENNYKISILVINDLGEKDQALEKVCAKFQATVLNTPYNMGSQEAINFGIRQQVENFKADLVMVMDADGQDEPEVIPELLKRVQPNTIVVAKRVGKRPEGMLFNILYALYKKGFHILTNVTPDFGNFSAYDQAMADRISKSPNFNITYSLALPLAGKIIKVPAKRQQRIKGKSRIGFQGLFNHAILSILPYLNIMAQRIAIFSSVLILIGLALAGTSMFLRIFMSDYAFPNWATTITFGTVTMALQLFMICLILFLFASLYRFIASFKR